MTNPRVQIDIVGNDQTGRATGPAEKRLKHLGGEAAKLDGRFKQMGSRTGGVGGLLGTFGKVESAASTAFGSKSVLGNITSRLGGVRKLGSVIDSSMSRASASTLRTSAALGEVEAAGEGAAATLGETAVAGGLAEGAIVGVGAAAGVAAGILVAAAAASFKLADGWAKGAASIGRTSDIIGVASDKLQQFQGAAERVGVDRNTAGAAIGGLSQTLNDARYGRNVRAQEVLARLNIPMKLNADGTVDVGAMLPGVARGLTGLNSSGRRTAAGILGIPEAALPALTQGDKALTADMADYGKNGAMQSASDIALGKKLARRSVLMSQWGEKKTNDLQRWNAGLNDKVEDFAVGASAKGTALIGAAGQKIETGGRAIERAAGRLAAAATGTGVGAAITRPGLTPEAIAAAQAAERKWGLPASVSLAQYQVESSLGRNMPRGSNNPFGIKEFNPNRPRVWAMTSEFRHGRMVKVPQPFRVFSSSTEAFDEHARMLMRSGHYADARRALPNVGEFVRRVAPVYATDPDYRAKFTRAEQSYRQYDGDTPIPVKVDVHLHGGGKHDKVVVTAGHSSRPAVSHASGQQGNTGTSGR